MAKKKKADFIKVCCPHCFHKMILPEYYTGSIIYCESCMERFFYNELPVVPIYKEAGKSNKKSKNESMDVPLEPLVFEDAKMNVPKCFPADDFMKIFCSEDDTSIKNDLCQDFSVVTCPCCDEKLQVGKLYIESKQEIKCASCSSTFSPGASPFVYTNPLGMTFHRNCRYFAFFLNLLCVLFFLAFVLLVIAAIIWGLWVFQSGNIQHNHWSANMIFYSFGSFGISVVLFILSVMIRPPSMFLSGGFETISILGECIAKIFCGIFKIIELILAAVFLGILGNMLFGRKK